MENEIIKDFAKAIRYKWYKKSYEKYLDYIYSVIKFYSLDEKLPTILSQKEYNQNQGLELFRGVKSLMNFANYKRDFATGKYQRYHQQGNTFGAGLYFATKHEYAKDFANPQNPNIISVKLKEDANIPYWEDFKELVNNNRKQIQDYFQNIFQKKVSDLDIREYVEYIQDNWSYLPIAALFGIDGIKYGITSNHIDNYVIFNRDCLVVNKTEFLGNCNSMQIDSPAKDNSSTGPEPGEE